MTETPENTSGSKNDINLERQQEIAVLIQEIKEDPRAFAEAYLLLKAERDKLSAENAEMRPLVDRDPMTGLLNIRGWERAKMEDSDRIVREQQSSAIFMTDIDNFKVGINDRYGHHVGNLVIQLFGQVFDRTLRDSDRKARQGGDEFAALLVDLDHKQADEIRQRIREEFRNAGSHLPEDHELRPYIEKGMELDVSIGMAHIGWTDEQRAELASWPPEESHLRRAALMASLEDEADKDMYVIKRERKGRGSQKGSDR